MRSVSILTALAFTSLAAAGPRQPKPATTTYESSITSIDTETALSTETQSPIVIRNAVAGGGFAIADPDSESGITGFSAQGQALHINGGCYKGDGSKDDGCVELTDAGVLQSAVLVKHHLQQVPA